MVVLFLAQNIEITKFFFIKTALLKNKIITIFVKLLHKSFVSWNKKVRWSTPLSFKHVIKLPVCRAKLQLRTHSTFSELTVFRRESPNGDVECRWGMKNSILLLLYMHLLEGHSVERMYLRQRCSDGSRWIKPFQNHASLQRRAANTYTWDFPDVIQFRVAALIRHHRKQSGSGIRTIIRIGLKS